MRLATGFYVLAVVGLAALAKENAQTESAPIAEFRTSVQESLAMPKNRPVHVEFTGSPELSAEAGRILSSMGYAVSAKREGTAVLLISGHYRATRGPLTTGDIAINELTENAAAAERELRARPTPQPILALDAGVMHEGNRLTGSLGGGIITNIAGNALMNVTGLGAFLNHQTARLLGSDPYRFCFHGCEQQRKEMKYVRQLARIHVTLKDGGQIHELTAEGEIVSTELLPGLLISAVFYQALAAMQ